MNIVAMIPARGGSKGITGKNMRQIGGKPLILHTTDAAKSSKRVSRVIFTTDSEEMKTLALNHGIEAPFIRPEALSNDTTCMVDVMAHCVGWLKEKEGYITDLLVTLYPTSPFRTGEHIDRAIDLLIQSNADCLVSVSMQKHHPYWTLDIDEDGKLNHYFGKNHLYYRRQDMPVTYEQNGAIYIVPPGNISRLDKRSMTDNTLAFIMDGESGINIDNEMDLLLADALFQKRQADLSKKQLRLIGTERTAAFFNVDYPTPVYEPVNPQSLSLK